MVGDLRDSDKKDLIKEALKEWIDETVLEFGKWSLKTLFKISIGALLVFLVTHGYLKVGD